MITVLIAAGAGVGGILIGAGWCIWRVSARFTLQARPARPRVAVHPAPAGEPTHGPTIGPRGGSGQMRASSRGRIYDHPFRNDASADYGPHGLDSFDVAPAIPYPNPVNAEHPPTDIDD